MIKKVLRSPVTTVVLFALAAVLIGVGGFRAISAAPAVQSNLFGAQVQLTEIHTAIVENGELVYGEDDLLRKLYLQGEEVGLDTFKIGTMYDEVLSVRNVYHDKETREGSTADNYIPEYVRVTVSTFWTKDGEKVRETELDPGLIQLHYLTDNGWTIDEAASTKERTVLYYNNPNSADGSLAVGEESNPFADKFVISGDVIKAVSKAADGNDEYQYDGYKFHIQARVDAVQTHNADEARMGAWGKIDAN